MGRLGFDRGVLADGSEGFATRSPSTRDEAGRDRRLRARAAGEEPSLDEDDVGALAHGSLWPGGAGGV